MKYVAILFACFLGSVSISHAQTVHEVKMLNRNALYSMPYEPDFLSIQPGDKVRFIPTDSSHHAATIKGFIPEGATKFLSKIDEDFTTEFTVPGFYGIRCAPHYSMGMVMLIRVGDAPLDSLVIPQDVGIPEEAIKRFEIILERAKSQNP